jgi:hypothetical protein
LKWKKIDSFTGREKRPEEQFGGSERKPPQTPPFNLKRDDLSGSKLKKNRAENHLFRMGSLAGFAIPGTFRCYGRKGDVRRLVL